MEGDFGEGVNLMDVGEGGDDLMARCCFRFLDWEICIGLVGGVGICTFSLTHHLFWEICIHGCLGNCCCYTLQVLHIARMRYLAAS